MLLNIELHSWFQSTCEVMDDGSISCGSLGLSQLLSTVFHLAHVLSDSGPSQPAEAQSSCVAAVAEPLLLSSAGRCTGGRIAAEEEARERALPLPAAQAVAHVRYFHHVANTDDGAKTVFCCMLSGRHRSSGAVSPRLPTAICSVH